MIRIANSLEEMMTISHQKMIQLGDHHQTLHYSFLICVFAFLVFGLS